MIIVYGGSFNPPTYAHYEIAKYLLEKYKPYELIFVPVGDHYQKDELESFSHRFEMLEIITEKLGQGKVSDIESGDFRGTIATLDYFQEKYPIHPIYFVLGADNLQTLDQWVEVERLLQDYYFLVLNRHQFDVRKYLTEHPLLNQFQHKFVIESKLPELPYSSTQYRQGDDGMVLEEINDYIKFHRLYQRGDRNEE